MKRRNFLRGLLGTGAVVVAAPVIAKVVPDFLSQDSMDKLYADMGEPVIGNDAIRKLGTPMKVSGDPLSTGSFAKEISGGFEKHYEKMKPVYLNEIFTKK